jgi:hypothetical protein
MLCFVSCTEEAPTPEQPPVDGETPDGGSGEPAPHVHAFGNWTVIKKATCGSKGQRLRLCPCGERETESVTATELHICGANNNSTVCDKEWEFSKGLSYELNADGLSYTVVGYESDFGQELVLPCYYEGLPVTAIGPDAFRGVETMISADLTDYIVEIGASAFEDCSALATVRFDKNSHLTVVGERAFAGTAITAFEVFSMVSVVASYGWPMELWVVPLFPVISLANYFLFFGRDIANVFPSSWRINARRAVQKKPKGPKVVPFPTAGSYEASVAKPKAPYTHRCTVCGRTDTEFPDLEFRYCSRCKGYHCYCEDHISNHAHIE